MLNNHLLINEIQLGSNLNECIHSNRRSDFGLMLAMLTDDVLEFSEFTLPKAVDNKKLMDEARLRKLFDLPPQTALALTSLEEINRYNEASLVNENNLSAVHFSDALKPKPIAFRDDKKHIEHDVLTNTSLHTQERHKVGNHNSLIDEMSFNANEWLKTVQQSIVSVSLVS